MLYKLLLPTGNIMEKKKKLVATVCKIAQTIMGFCKCAALYTDVQVCLCM